MEKENKKIRDIVDAFGEISSNSFEHLPILASEVGEYLDSFIIVGFDNNGNRVTSATIKSEMHLDALARQVYRVNRMFDADFEKELERDIIQNEN